MEQVGRLLLTVQPLGVGILPELTVAVTSTVPLGLCQVKAASSPTVGTVYWESEEVGWIRVHFLPIPTLRSGDCHTSGHLTNPVWTVPSLKENSPVSAIRELPVFQEELNSPSQIYLEVIDQDLRGDVTLEELCLGEVTPQLTDTGLSHHTGQKLGASVH